MKPISIKSCVVFAAFVLIVSCALYFVFNYYSLTDPPQDALDVVLDREILSEVDPTDVESLYTFGQEVVYVWSPEAYFYYLGLYTSCNDFTTHTWIFILASGTLT